MNDQHSSLVSRPRILCVSHDRSTSACLSPSLTGESVDIVIAQQAADASHCLEQEPIDAVVIDGKTVTDVPALIDALESEAPEVPTFVAWEGSDGCVLSEVTGRATDTDPAAHLAATISDRLEDGADTGLARTSEIDERMSEVERIVQTLPADLAGIVEAVRCRLVDATSPLTVERAVREELTADGRFEAAWIGEYDHGERAIVPWLADPDAMAWSLQRTFSIGDGKHPLIERAMRTRALQTRRCDETNCDAVPFGERAIEHGARSTAVIPLAEDDELFGVIVVYATTPLSKHERDAIRAIATTASHVLETIAVRGRLEQRERTLHRYERLVETVGDGMYVLDDTGHFTTVNDALVEMTGYSREGLLGEHASILFDHEAIADAETVIQSLLTSDDATDTVELSLETKTGDRIPCEAQIAVLVPDNEFLGSVGVFRDITERKRRERQLREQNERLDAFARIVSHDLRNPLSVAQGYLDLLEETGDLEYAEQTRDGLDRMASIIDDVLAIARDGEWVTGTDTVDLESITREAWDYVSTGETTLSISATTTLEADRSRLLRLLENCIRNSIEHGETTETVRIGLLEAADHDDTERGFFIEDDGEGFPSDLRTHLFDPSVSSSTEGLGIGLWVVREVATGHGWSVAATESEDGGARFEFEFETDDYLSD